MKKSIIAASIAASAAALCLAETGELPEGAFAAREAKAVPPEVRTVTVDPTKALGPIKPLNGVNNAPIRGRAYQSTAMKLKDPYSLEEKL